MDGERVHPKTMWEFRVAEGDVAAHSESITVARPMAEESCHMGEGPETVSGEGRMGGDACPRVVSQAMTRSRDMVSIVGERNFIQICTLWSDDIEAYLEGFRRS